MAQARPDRPCTTPHSWELRIVASEGNGPKGVFRDVVVDGQEAVIEEACQCDPVV